MKITKTQIDYLRDRLRDIKADKIEEASSKAKTNFTSLDIYEAIKSGEVKLKAKKDIYQRSYRANGYRNPDLTDFFDLSKFEDKSQAAQDVVEAYKEKLDKKMTEIMDKVVLSDLLIEEAVAEFKKM